MNDVNSATYAGGAVYTPSGTGAVATTVQTKLRESVSVKDFGAKGDGVTDDTAALNLAKTAIAVGGTILFPTGSYVISSVDFTGKSATLLGYGATIICTSATGAIYKTDHDNKLAVFGIKFSGTSTYRAINHQSAPSGTSYDELEIIDCQFDMGSGIYGIYCVGTREPKINGCLFKNTNSGCGIYFKDCVSPFLFQDIFRGSGYVGRAVYYPGTGNGTDAGLVLRDCEIMGWDKGLEVIGCDWLHVSGCTIDYCNQSIKCAAQDGASFIGNYIGSLGATTALWLTYDATVAAAPLYCDKIIIQNNHFTGHYSGASTYDNILVDGAVTSDNIQIRNNSLAFYTRYGINLTMTNGRASITGNSFSQRTGFGSAPIYNTLGTSDSGFTIKDNFFSNATTITAMNLSFAKIKDNIGCITENKGQAFATAGASSFIIPHGLAYTPVSADISFSPMNLETAQKSPYLAGQDATNITINLTSAAVGTVSVSWRVNKTA